ncbi:hypothetical protein CVT25_012113 [Psilocybe cyanescens]|uniref:PX domain-containing protein n=1 Tax=Psilocybe cyanescens TaxID=93625 RepID=A0A409XJ42_PSICY|nr:hypothetical protein CVT25_012113 [Psilocybe cyanescens]
MLLVEFNSQSTSDTGLPSDQYKRAVLRPPPSRFSVEFLATTKSSGSYNHGMHIAPIMFDDDMSVSSRGRQTEYDIWRRWEDCLWLQETLEQEYRRSAREKKIRLQQGKGVKSFNGMYKQDMASSWESLPPGPDPNSVAQDIHGYLPKLSKKGTLFRASQATIENRQKEFRHLVETLFSDEMPALVQEIRASTIVTDFFGLWRRDYDILESSKQGQRNSLTSSVFSSYFSASSPSLSGRSTVTTSTPRKRVSSSASSTSTSSSDVPDGSLCPSSRRSSIRSNDTALAHRPRRRPLSSTSSDSSSIHSDGSSDSCSTTSTNPAIVAEASIGFGHNPESHDRPSSILEILPEERELLSKSSDGYLPVPVPRRTKASLMERKANRCFSIVGHPLDRHDESEPPRPSIRESWQTTSSMDSNADALLEGIGLMLPHKIKEQKYRASVASISTFMTTDSAEAVIPSEKRRSNQSRLRISTPLSLSDFEIYSDDADADEDCTSILDAFPHPNTYHSEQHDHRPATPTSYHDSSESPSTPSTPDSIQSSFNRPPSPVPSTASSTVSTTFSVSTTSSSLSPGTSISIKAAFNSSIILLRVSRETTLADIRQRLYNKFVGQEGVPLSKSFDIIFVPAAQSSPTKDRSSSISVSSMDLMDLFFIHSDDEWQELISTTSGSKVNLRIMDSCK